MKKNILPFVLLFSGFLTTHAQTISTVAGNNILGYTGDGYAATSASLYGPDGIVFDAAGNYYISDEENNVIRMVTSSGIISTYAGNYATGGTYGGDAGPATSASFWWPIGVAIDASGNFYIGDRRNSRVRIINTSGTIETYAGNGSYGYNGDGIAATSSELTNVNSIAIDASGNIYFEDSNNSRIRKVDKTSGIITTFAGNGVAGYAGNSGPATSAELNYPFGLAFDNIGNLYISDQSNNVIRKVNTSGTISTFAGNNIQGYSGDGGDATLAELSAPAGVTIGPAGNLYISDTENDIIRKVSKNTGIITTIAGIPANAGYSGDGAAATSAELHYPNQSRFDSHGNLYIPDWGNQVVRMVTNVETDEGINELSNNNNVSIYPNPADKNITITTKGMTGTLIYSLYNMVGQQVYTVNATGKNMISINVSDFSSGIYILKVQSERNAAITKFEISR